MKYCPILIICVLISFIGCDYLNSFSGFREDDFSVKPSSRTSADIDLTVGSSSEWRIIKINEKKTYKFSAQKGISYVLSFYAIFGVVLDIFLVDKNSQVVKSWKSNSGRISWNCYTSGDYYFILVNKMYSDLDVSLLLNIDKNEPDNSFANARKIEVHGEKSNAFLMSGDRDFYRFSAKAGSCYHIETTDTDYCKLSLFSADTKLILSDSIPELDILWVCSLAGDYYSMISHNDSSVFMYNLSVMEYDNDEYEPDNSMAEAKKIEIGLAAQKHVLLPQDVDYIKFTAEKGTKYRITSTGISSLPLCNSAGSSASIYVKPVGYIPKDTTIKNEWVCTENGTYYLRAKGDSYDRLPMVNYSVILENGR